jgi:prevent-host-death family protein
MQTISQRELCARMIHVLREVKKGEVIRITVDGHAIADLVPVAEARREFVPRAKIERLLRRALLDRKFGRDLNAVIGETIDDL